MRFLIILLFALNFSILKADEIYNLIKIPNLEIYKLNSSNGIRYLNTKNDFRIGVDDNITCNKTDLKNLENKFPIITKNFEKYSSTFLKLNNLKYIVLCENLFISGINTGGIPEFSKRTLIIDLNFNPQYFERMLHHEFFHMIQNSHNDLFDEALWTSFNENGFKYAECSTCSDQLNLDLYQNTDGFLTEYSKSIASEDMAEIFSFLMVDKNMVESKTINDQILKNKMDMILKSIHQIDNQFNF